MRINTAAQGLLKAFLTKVREARKQEEPQVVEFIRVPRLSHPVGRRHTYYWPGRRVAASLRTAGKTRRMR
jgi:hypothetical protein